MPTGEDLGRTDDPIGARSQRSSAAVLPVVDKGEENRDPVRIAVVGLGYWGPTLSRVVHELRDAELEVVCDLRPELVTPILKRYPSVRSTTNFEDVIADPAVEAVLIATPIGTHADLARRVLEAGKHAFVEKPLATTVTDATALDDLASERGLILMPGHTFLYSPPVNVVRGLIERGDLGEIYFISMSRVNLGIHQTDVSVVWDLAPHDLSILRYWLDEIPQYASAVSRSCVIPGIADVAFIDLGFESGVLVHAELSWLSPSKLRRTTIVGSKMMVVYDDTSPEPVRIFDSGVAMRDPQTFGEYRLSYRVGDIISPQVAAAEPLSLELEDFCRAVRSGEAPRSSAQTGIDVIRILEAVDRSLALDSRRVAVDRS